MVVVVEVEVEVEVVVVGQLEWSAVFDVPI